MKLVLGAHDQETIFENPNLSKFLSTNIVKGVLFDLLD